MSTPIQVPPKDKVPENDPDVAVNPKPGMVEQSRHPPAGIAGEDDDAVDENEDLEEDE